MAIAQSRDRNPGGSSELKGWEMYAKQIQLYIA